MHQPWQVSPLRPASPTDPPPSAPASTRSPALIIQRERLQLPGVDEGRALFKRLYGDGIVEPGGVEMLGNRRLGHLGAADDPEWTVAGLDQGVQTRALALDLDDQGRYVLTGYNCFDVCEPVGEVRVYAPGGTLAASTISLGPLGSAWFGPHDIAWSPAGYAVVALGELQGQTFVFKVQAVAPGAALPLWTFLPGNKQGLQLALAVAVGLFGEVYAGGIGGADHPAFARIGS